MFFRVEPDAEWLRANEDSMVGPVIQEINRATYVFPLPHFAENRVQYLSLLRTYLQGPHRCDHTPQAEAGRAVHDWELVSRVLVNPMTLLKRNAGVMEAKVGCLTQWWTNDNKRLTDALPDCLRICVLSHQVSMQ